MGAQSVPAQLAHALDFTGKTVFITGGGVGIGRAVAEAFAGAGARVIVAEIDPDRAASVAAAIPTALVIECDVRERGVPAMLAERIGEACGQLDVLVNNVGHFVHARPFALLSDEETDAILDTNLGQLLRITRAMIPLLRSAAPGSSIINLTSIEAHRGIPYCSVYAAAKWAVAGLTRSLALELGPEGIRVNDIAPETTDTPQLALEHMIPPANRVHEERWIPLGRFGRPADCAGAALYLASPLAAWVTGTTLHVDGGALAAAGWYRTPQGEWTNVPLISGNGLVIPGVGGLSAPSDDDRAALRRTAELYALGADRRDKDLWRTVLADDIAISGPGFAIHGLEANLGSIDHLARAFTATRHSVIDQEVTVLADEARGETRSTAEHRLTSPEGGDRLLVWAIRYQDRWRREYGTWRFTERSLIVDWEELRPVHAAGQA